MNETAGVVERVEGEHVWVRATGAANACGACARKEGCGTAGMGSVLDKALGRPTRLLRLPNTIHARPGDAVVVCSADGQVLRAVWLAYGLPLLLGMAAAMLLLAFTGHELAALAGLLAGLAGGFLIVKRRGLDVARGEPIFSIAFKQSS